MIVSYTPILLHEDLCTMAYRAFVIYMLLINLVDDTDAYHDV